ncbi:hypothetical protein ACMZ6S_04850 [Streptococcus pluranimalium]
MKLLYLVALILSAIFSFCHQDYLCKLASVLMVMGGLNGGWQYPRDGSHILAESCYDCDLSWNSLSIAKHFSLLIWTTSLGSDR